MPHITPSKDPVRTFARSIRQIGARDIQQMYRLYASFYEQTSLDVFLSDLAKKSHVILVARKADQRIVGFSTLTVCDFDVDGKRVRGLFSGDTIIEPAYWGNNGLVTTFYRQLIVERFKRPFTPFYWLLISKGYKTYLLLTNNFYRYYPCAQREEPHLARITQAYCEQLFPEAFDKQRMLLDFGDSYVRLKDDVARITPELTAANTHIAHFERINPTWERGTEVPCVGVFDYATLLRSIFDVPWKWFKKQVLGTHRPPPGTHLDPVLSRKQAASPARAAADQPAWLDDDEDGLNQSGAS